MIAEFKGQLPISRMCALLRIARGSYYHFRKRSGKRPAGDHGDLVGEIEKIVLDFPGYGYRRVKAHLEKKGIQVNHKRVLRIMREKNLTLKPKKRYIRAGKQDYGLYVFPNRLKGFAPKGVNELWVADITFIRLRTRFAYLATILDAYSRKVVGWSLKDNLKADLALEALKIALLRRELKEGLIHHSDRGFHYSSSEYVRLLKSHGILISMSRAGNPYDNAKAESFIATLKREEVSLSEYENILDARSQIGYFIEDVYNEKRLHSALGYLSPTEFEKRQSRVGCP